MTKKPKSLPKFRSEGEERRFWETHDSKRLYRLEEGTAGTFSKS